MRLAGPLLIVLLGAAGFFAMPARAGYVPGTIQPSHLSQAGLDAALNDFYATWKSVYLIAGCGEGRYYVGMAADGNPTYGGSAERTITVSEAHGYGMLIAVMMARFDPEAQTIFDGLVAYRRDHPAEADPALLAWNQVEGCTDAIASNGVATATDGDLDVAYALLLADSFWGSAGEIDYAAEARAMISAILEVEVSPDGDFLLLGDWARESDQPAYRRTTRASDFMVSHLKAFADATGEPRWLSVRDRTYAIMQAIGSEYAPETGLMPDFIIEAGTAPRPAPPAFMESPGDGWYSWNSCRYPWRIGLDYLLYGEPRALEALAVLNRWAQKTTGGDPTRFNAVYQLDGSTTPESYENALAYVAPLGVAAMIDADNQDWLNAIWDAVVAKQVEDDDYYGNTIKLLSMIVMAGHWPAP